MVVITLIAVLLAVVVFNFPATKLQFSLSRVAYKFGQDVKKVQDLALSSTEYQDQSGQTYAVSGYGVYVDVSGLGNKKYIFYADKAPGNHQYDAQDYVIETIDFSTSEP